MQFFDALAARHSTRAFSPAPVPAEKLDLVLAAAQAAPVGMGRYESLALTVVSQAPAVAVLHSKMNELFPKGNPLYDAPAFILVSSGPEAEAQANAACLVENMLLACAAQGLASCYIGGAIPTIAANARLCKELAVPEGFTPVAGVVLGLPKDAAELEARKTLAAAGRIPVARL